MSEGLILCQILWLKTFPLSLYFFSLLISSVKSISISSSEVQLDPVISSLSVSNGYNLFGRILISFPILMLFIFPTLEWLLTYIISSDFLIWLIIGSIISRVYSVILMIGFFSVIFFALSSLLNFITFLFILNFCLIVLAYSNVNFSCKYNPFSWCSSNILLIVLSKKKTLSSKYSISSCFFIYNLQSSYFLIFFQFGEHPKEPNTIYTRWARKLKKLYFFNSFSSFSFLLWNNDAPNVTSNELLLYALTINKTTAIVPKRPPIYDRISSSFWKFL